MKINELTEAHHCRLCSLCVLCGEYVTEPAAAPCSLWPIAGI
jgi:hypothetical protein